LSEQQTRSFRFQAPAAEFKLARRVDGTVLAFSGKGPGAGGRLSHYPVMYNTPPTSRRQLSGSDSAAPQQPTPVIFIWSSHRTSAERRFSGCQPVRLERFAERFYILNVAKGCKISVKRC
jgi:hypothetical protein